MIGVALGFYQQDPCGRVCRYTEFMMQLLISIIWILIYSTSSNHLNPLQIRSGLDSCFAVSIQQLESRLESPNLQSKQMLMEVSTATGGIMISSSSSGPGSPLKTLNCLIS